MKKTKSKKSIIFAVTFSIFSLCLVLNVCTGADESLTIKEIKADEVKTEEVKVEEIKVEKITTNEVKVEEIKVEKIAEDVEEKEIENPPLVIKISKIDSITEELEEYGPIKEKSSGLYVWTGQKIEWCVNNLVRSDGWQLTGWSKVLMTKNFQPVRFKFGFFGPDFYGSDCEDKSKEQISREDFTRYVNQHIGPRSDVIGFFIGWSF